ncbi:RES family NAD+ phosphorylase [Dongia sp.]|uniref:RES family NAD+ phosphorylase n=1 Tax=Dongia sp. TaxID=1977262 RepID=UPI0035B3A705
MAIERTIRLVSSARLRDPVLLKLVSPEKIDELSEIEGATSARLRADKYGQEGLLKGELVHGIAHERFINAAFTYWRPRDRNRFNGPGRGAWYSAFKVETCIAEVAYHLSVELTRIDDFNTAVEYAEMFASFAGDFIDLRDLTTRPECLHPDPKIGYPAGNMLADKAVSQGHNGIIFPSVRDIGGTCLVALRPHAVQSVAQGRVYRLTWKGSAEPVVQDIGG